MIRTHGELGYIRYLDIADVGVCVKPGIAVDQFELESDGLSSNQGQGRIESGGNNLGQ